MTSLSPKYGNVLRYVYALTAIVVIAAIAVMTALFLSQGAERAARDRIALYYLASSAVTEQLYRDTQAVSRLAMGDGPESGRQVTGLSGSLFSMRGNVQRLRELQERYAADEFVATLERVTSQFGTIDDLLAEQGFTADAAPEHIAAFELSIEQLNRLHKIAAADTWAKLKTRTGRVLPNLAILALILTVAVMVGWYAVRLLRKSLAKQEQTEAALAASQERMHHMQKLEALGQLVGGVAHDFNNLLTAILGQAQLLEEQSRDDASMQQGLQEIRMAGRQAAALTSQLLTFSRRQPIETQAVDLNELIRGMEPILHRLIGEDIKLDFDYGDIRDAIEMDRGRMSQVILNLFINARDAMPDGGRISLTTAPMQIADATRNGIPKGSYAKIVVADNGVGMTKETLDRAFEPFFTTKSRGRGTGLGLATVHGIVTAANGHIFADSVPGEGARFEIYWPSSVRRPELSAADPVTRKTGSETILVVEDEEQIRNLLHVGLGALGYRVLTASSGADGLEICRSEPDGIDVIVSDVVMPGINGADFMNDALLMRPDAVGIFMSGYTDDVVLQRGVDGAVIPLINKPFELDALAKLIRQRLRGRVARDATRLHAMS